MNKDNLIRSLRNSYPRSCEDDERIGAFWLPFIAGAVVSAPVWYVIGNNKANDMTQYPTYYPYQPYSYNNPAYYPYPPYGYH
ncbi:MAG: hypothetical protein ACI4U5_05870 [Bacilli bacterium]